MKHLTLALLAACFAFNAHAEIISGRATAVAPTCVEGQPCEASMDLSSALRILATVSASVTGFAPAVTGTPITAATAPGTTGTLPAGAVVVAFNTSTTVGAFCKLGATATVADVAIPPSSWFAYTVGVATQLTCVTATSTAVINLVGGSGIATGAGGGGGGSSLGASIGLTGAAVPTSADFIGVTDAGTLRGWPGNTAGGFVQGNVASGVADAGNPVKSGGKYNASPPTFADGQRGDVQLDVNGNVKVNVVTAAGVAQGSTTAGQTVSPIGCRTLTSAPSDTTAQTNMPWCTLGGAVATSPQATENHIGEVGGNIIDIENAMTTSNNAIAAGESFGGIQTLANAVRVSGTAGNPGTGGTIQKVLVTFKDVTAATAVDVVFFNAALAGATCADNTNFTLANGDRTKIIGIAHMTDFSGTTNATTAPTTMQANNLAIPFALASTTNLLVCPVNRGATFTPADTSGASIKVTIYRN